MNGIQHWGSAPPAVRSSDVDLDKAVLAADMVFWTGGPNNPKGGTFGWYGNFNPDYQINHPHSQSSAQQASAPGP